MTTAEITQMLTSFIGQMVLASGGGAVVAVLLFQFLGKTWIQNFLAKDLEAAKAEIAVMAAKQLKFHDQEYFVLPQIWEKLCTANASLGAAVVSFRQIPDLNKYSSDELAEWISSSDLSSDERNYIIKEADKFRAYSRILDFRDIARAHADYIAFRDFFRANRIFLHEEISDILDKANNLIWRVWVDKKMDLESISSGGKRDFMLEAYNNYEKELRPLLSEIEVYFREKFIRPVDKQKGSA